MRTTRRSRRPQRTLAAAGLAIGVSGVLLAGCSGTSSPAASTTAAGSPAESSATGAGVTTSAGPTSGAAASTTATVTSAAVSTVAPTSSAASASAPATTPAVRLTASDGSFATAFPTGWQDMTTKAEGGESGHVVLAAAAPASGGFSTNVIVSTQSGDARVAQQWLQAYQSDATGKGLKVESSDTATIGGEPASGMLFSGGVRANVQYDVSVYAFAHNGVVYSVLTTYSPGQEQSAVTAFRTLVAAWAWK